MQSLDTVAEAHNRIVKSKDGAWADAVVADLRIILLDTPWDNSPGHPDRLFASVRQVSVDPTCDRTWSERIDPGPAKRRIAIIDTADPRVVRVWGDNLACVEIRGTSGGSMNWDRRDG